MRRKLIYLALCMPLCLLLVADRAPVAQSVPQPTGPKIADDGKCLPDEEGMAKLAADDPCAFLEASIKRQVREVKRYSGELHKTERIRGKVQTPEVIDFWFKEDPYSVLMKWRVGNRGGKASLYVQGQNNDQVAILTKINFVLDLHPEGRLVQDGGRYSIREFSIRQATERTHRAWKAAKDKGILNVEYLGKKPVAELDGRTCYLLKRTCSPPEEEGVVTVDVAIDAETWLQTGSALIDGQGHLIGRYHFKSLKINPDFATDQFDRAMLKR